MFNGLFDIVFFAMLAAFLAFRLYNVLGRKDDDDGSAAPISKYWKGQAKPKGLMGNVVALPVPGKPPVSLAPQPEAEPPFSESVPASLRPVLEAIYNGDKNFTERQFIKGAQMAFEMILAAFAKGDKAALQPLLSKELYADFIQDIEAREQQGEQLDITVVAVLGCEITDATLSKGVASVTVKFSSEQIIVTRNKEGEIIAGNPAQVDVVDDFWTFSRQVSSSNPNWKLVMTNQTA